MSQKNILPLLSSELSSEKEEQRRGMIKTSQIGVMLFVIKHAIRSGLSLVVLLLEFSIQEVPDFLRLAADRNFKGAWELQAVFFWSDK